MSEFRLGGRPFWCFSAVVCILLAIHLRAGKRALSLGEWKLRVESKMAARILFAVTMIALSCPKLGIAETLSDSRSTLVVIVSGFLSDASAEQISNKAPRGQGNSGMYQVMADLKSAGFTAIFFNWNGTSAGHYYDNGAQGAKKIVAAIRDACAKNKIEHLVLVGHSWGGHTMLEVAQGLNAAPAIKIELAIGVDPSSFARDQSTSQLPPNIGKLVYFHTGNAFCWSGWKDETRVECIDLGNPANGFMHNGKPDYAAVFDISAHNAVEWDERIHAELVSRIKKTVAAKRSSPMKTTKQ